MPLISSWSRSRGAQSGSICRFCLDSKPPSGSEGDERRLVAPCDCKGTSKFVHIACLKRWDQELRSSASADVVAQRAGKCPVCNSHLVVDGKALELGGCAAQGAASGIRRSRRSERQAWIASILARQWAGEGHETGSHRYMNTDPALLLAAVQRSANDPDRHSVFLVCDRERFCASGSVSGVTVRWRAVQLNCQLDDIGDPVCEAAQNVANLAANLKISMLAGGPLFSNRHPDGLYTLVTSLPYSQTVELVPPPVEGGQSVYATGPLTQGAAIAAIDEMQDALSSFWTSELCLVIRGFTSWDGFTLERQMQVGKWVRAQPQFEDIVATCEGATFHPAWAPIRFGYRETARHCGCICQ